VTVLAGSVKYSPTCSSVTDSASASVACQSIRASPSHSGAVSMVLPEVIRSRAATTGRSKV
jgi:hypothetical protein